MQRYTQGVMDLGATLCLPRQPRCGTCPLADICVARAQDRVLDYPLRTRKLKRSAQQIWLLCLQDASGAVWLDKRPTPGVWAGLYCLPLFDSEAALLSAATASGQAAAPEALPAFVHVLTHKDLHLHPWYARLTQKKPPAQVGKETQGQWFSAAQWPALGLPAPVRRLLEAGF